MACRPKDEILRGGIEIVLFGTLFVLFCVFFILTFSFSQTEEMNSIILKKK